MARNTRNGMVIMSQRVITEQAIEWVQKEMECEMDLNYCIKSQEFSITWNVSSVNFKGK